ncbi:MAG: GatB/YqeY domain-containing protein [Planctomycetota bacterium]|nr:GatB/YqeY domain-containing protein [Planctomycetota bacterium]
MSQFDQIQADVIAAMKAGDTKRRDTLRMVVAAIKNKAIDSGEDRGDVNDEVVMGVLLSAVKSRKDSMEQYESAGREELAAQERTEIEIIQGYLPQPLTEEETEALVKATIAETGVTSKKELGKVMKAIMATHKGRVEGKLIQRFAGQLLE